MQCHLNTNLAVTRTDINVAAQDVALPKQNQGKMKHMSLPDKMREAVGVTLCLVTLSMTQRHAV